MKKISFLLLSLILLSGCMQSTAMLGPAITVATSGNIYQAGLSYGTNLTIKETTGKSPSEHVVEYNSRKTMEKDLKDMIQKHILLTRKKISQNTRK
ncbi:hypothetical protein N9O80_01275 [Candidatus Pelagibacter sp.]|nr:hypothetical protein [Candidatus Pelagibacter sp.]